MDYQRSQNRKGCGPFDLEMNRAMQKNYDFLENSDDEFFMAVFMKLEINEMKTIKARLNDKTGDYILLINNHNKKKCCVFQLRRLENID